MVESHTDESVQNAILTHLAKSDTIEDTLELAKELGISHAELDKSLKSLLVDDYLVLQVIEKKLLELSAEGASYADNGTPEFIYASALEVKVPTEKSQADAKVGAEIAKIGFSKAMQRKWI
jgi:predicted transcriptional regulator